MPLNKLREAKHIDNNKHSTSNNIEELWPILLNVSVLADLKNPSSSFSVWFGLNSLLAFFNPKKHH